MRLLADSAFPTTVEGPLPGGHHVERFTGSAPSDYELVSWAHESGFDVVVFLGRSALADQGLIAHGAEVGVVLAGTASTEPDEAVLSVKQNIGRIHRRVPPLVFRKNDILVLKDVTDVTTA